VNNPYGSTAGAGSGDFHVYRHARAREAERWKQITEEERKRKLEQEYNELLEANRIEEEQRTAQRRKKRQRLRDSKLRKKNLAKGGIALQDAQPEDENVQDDEFHYGKTSEAVVAEGDQWG
jgi:hypothetical protein